MKRARTLSEIFSILEDTASIKAMLTWPKFSMTSYKMISALAKQNISPRTVLDIGANVGHICRGLRQIIFTRTCHSFEPLPDSVTELRKNVHSLSNVTVYPYALGEEDGEVSIHLNSQSRASSILPLAQAHRKAFPEAQEKKTITVPVSSLDELLAKTQLPSPVLLKIDVQGYETHTLRENCETLKQVDYAILETSFKPMYQNELLFMNIVRLMKSYGLHLSRPAGWLTAPKNGEILQMDALFVKDRS